MATTRSAFIGPLLLLLVLPALVYGASTKPSLHQVQYVGIGYNILTGNPEGGALQNGGVDPGLEPLRRVFALTYDDGKLTSDNEYRVPDEVSFLPRSSAVISKEKEAFFGAKSYAKKLSHQVAVDASVSAVFVSFQFAASHRYESVNEEATTNGQVFFSEQSIENYGEIRYLLAKAEPSEMFITAVCALPASYNKATYMKFLDDWGTHVVKEATLGVKSGKNYKESKSSFVKDASTDNSNSVSVGGSYKIFSASLSVDVDRFSKSSASEEKFGEDFTSYTIGSKQYNEPISVSLMGINEALDSQYWSKQSEYPECSSFQRSTIQANIMKAFSEYPAHKNLSPAEDPPVEIPLTWPEGMYALPEAATLTTTCPEVDYMDWEYGLFYQKTEPGNECSRDNHLTNYCNRDEIRTYYCVKTIPNASGTSWTWTPGVYCIFKYGDTCPTGFGDGFIKWNDADKANTVDALGFDRMPSGTWGRGQKTQMDFCCRDDGQTHKPIFLPTATPFYLIKYKAACQEVNGMTSTEEFITWAVPQSDSALYQGGNYPHPGNTGRDIRIYYCFYQPSSSTKREVEETRELLQLLEKRLGSIKKSEIKDQQYSSRELSNESDENGESEEEGQNGNAKRLEQLLNLLAKQINIRKIDDEYKKDLYHHDPNRELDDEEKKDLYHHDPNRELDDEDKKDLYHHDPNRELDDEDKKDLYHHDPNRELDDEDKKDLYHHDPNRELDDEDKKDLYHHDPNRELNDEDKKDLYHHDPNRELDDEYKKDLYHHDPNRELNDEDKKDLYHHDPNRELNDEDKKDLYHHDPNRELDDEYKKDLYHHDPNRELDDEYKKDLYHHDPNRELNDEDKKDLYHHDPNRELDDDAKRLEQLLNLLAKQIDIRKIDDEYKKDLYHHDPNRELDDEYKKDLYHHDPNREIDDEYKKDLYHHDPNRELSDEDKKDLYHHDPNRELDDEYKKDLYHHDPNRELNDEDKKVIYDPENRELDDEYKKDLYHHDPNREIDDEDKKDLYHHDPNRELNEEDKKDLYHHDPNRELNEEDKKDLYHHDPNRELNEEDKKDLYHHDPNRELDDEDKKDLYHHDPNRELNDEDKKDLYHHDPNRELIDDGYKVNEEEVENAESKRIEELLNLLAKQLLAKR